ncbi:MAG: TonB family protein [Treponema sp.]|jgi:protein TonB|nr:TonB family protein [Treponema sp.]
MKRLRIAIFILVAEIHLLAIISVAFDMQPIGREEEPLRVMKLADLAEYVPPPPSPEPPPPEPPPPRPEPPPVIPDEVLPDNAVEIIAEEMIETDEEPADQILVEAGSIGTTASLPGATGWEEEEYLPAHRISVLPVFPEDEIRAALVYPPIAKRSGIEGRVILDLFIDRTGLIRRIDLLFEEPADRGFGEAAREAFQGIVCEPAKANGQAVSSRIRYPVSFRLR